MTFDHFGLMIMSILAFSACIKTAWLKRGRALSNIEGIFNPFLRFHIAVIYLLELLTRDFFFLNYVGMSSMVPKITLPAY